MWRMSRTVASAPSRSALLTTKTSPISRMPALAAWMPSPMPGREQHDGRVGQAGDLDLGLADADGLDEDDVAAGGVEHPQRLRGRPRQAAEVAARGHRADVDLGVERVVLHPDPVAEQRAAGERRRRVDGEHADPLAARAEGADEGVRRRRLAHARAAGEADDVRACRLCGASAAITSRSAGWPSSTSEISRATARGDPALADSTRAGTSTVRRPRSALVRVGQARGTRTMRASPWPPPPQSAAAPTPPPRRLSSSARCRAMRAPDMPIGWPRAMAPPLTLTLSTSMPSSLAEARPTAANASLISTRSRSAGVMPSFSQALAMARAGCCCSVESGPATTPWAPISASQVRPELLGLGLAHDDDRGGAVGDLRGRAGGDGAVLG